MAKQLTLNAKKLLTDTTHAGCASTLWPRGQHNDPFSLLHPTTPTTASPPYRRPPRRRADVCAPVVRAVPNGPRCCPCPCVRRGHTPALSSRGSARVRKCARSVPAVGHCAGPLHSLHAQRTRPPPPPSTTPLALYFPVARTPQHHQHHNHLPSLYVVHRSMSLGLASTCAPQWLAQRAW